MAWETAPYYCDGLVPLLISGLLLLNVPKLQSSCHTTWLCCFLCLMLLPYKQDGYYHLSRGREAMQGFCVCMYMCVSVCAHMHAYGHQKQKSQGIKTGRGSKINKYKKYNLVFCICPWISLFFFLSQISFHLISNCSGIQSMPDIWYELCLTNTDPSSTIWGTDYVSAACYTLRPCDAITSQPSEGQVKYKVCEGSQERCPQVTFWKHLTLKKLSIFGCF